MYSLASTVNLDLNKPEFEPHIIKIETFF
jgi:hypothetical protein